MWSIYFKFMRSNRFKVMNESILVWNKSKTKIGLGSPKTSERDVFIIGAKTEKDIKLSFCSWFISRFLRGIHYHASSERRPLWISCVLENMFDMAIKKSENAKSRHGILSQYNCSDDYRFNRAECYSEYAKGIKSGRFWSYSRSRYRRGSR